MFLITFHTNFDANLFSRKAKELGQVKLKPVPRQLSSSCGTSVVFTPDIGEIFPEKLLSLSYEKIYSMHDGGEKYQLLFENE